MPKRPPKSQTTEEDDIVIRKTAELLSKLPPFKLDNPPDLSIFRMSTPKEEAKLTEAEVKKSFVID